MLCPNTVHSPCSRPFKKEVVVCHDEHGSSSGTSGVKFGARGAGVLDRDG